MGQEETGKEVKVTVMTTQEHNRGPVTSHQSPATSRPTSSSRVGPSTMDKAVAQIVASENG